MGGQKVYVQAKCLIFQTQFGDSPLWLVIQEQCFDACKMLIEEYNVNINEINK